MKHFQYQAVTRDGKKIKGIVEAKSEKNAVEVLHSKDLVITGISDQSESFSFKLMSNFSKVRFGELVSMTRQLATMINSGLPILGALRLLRKKTSVALRKVVDEIMTQVEGGASLYNAMAGFPDVFSSIYLALVKSGELAGVLDTVLLRLAENMEKQHEFRQKVKSSMLYPMIVIGAMFVAGGIMVFIIMPKISELYSQFETDLPAMTKIVLGVSAFIRTKWYFFLLILVGLAATVIFALKTEKGKKKFDQYILKAPIIGELQNKIISANTMNTLSLLVKSGVSIVDSIDVIAEGAGNYTYQRALENVSTNVEKGMSLSEAFTREDVYPELIVQMMAVGEETGKLDEMLNKIAEQFRKESEMALEAMTKAIEPALIIVLGVGVGLMVISVIIPIYNLTSSL